MTPLRAASPKDGRWDFPTDPDRVEQVRHTVSTSYSHFAGRDAVMAVICLTSDREQADQVNRLVADDLDQLAISTQLSLWADDYEWSDFTSGQDSSQTREKITAWAVWVYCPSRGRTSSGQEQ
ncbi:MAG: hypothetical protein QM621_02075 [Aeromicrobium sp.]|uniref:hypothetical protein n=1 Tax=Aeromicrobium sp. TaxID=1871063 RepID=UPI0039E4E660